MLQAIIFEREIPINRACCAKVAPLELGEILSSKGYGQVGSYRKVRMLVGWGFRNQKTIVG
jgi:hypothetical protein